MKISRLNVEEIKQNIKNREQNGFTNICSRLLNKITVIVLLDY